MLGLPIISHFKSETCFPLVLPSSVYSLPSSHYTLPHMALMTCFSSVQSLKKGVYLISHSLPISFFFLLVTTYHDSVLCIIGSLVALAILLFFFFINPTRIFCASCFYSGQNRPYHPKSFRSKRFFLIIFPDICDLFYPAPTILSLSNSFFLSPSFSLNLFPSL